MVWSPIFEIEPVTLKLPVILADPVYGNGGVDAPPGAYEALKAFVAYEAVTAYEADITDPP